MQTELIIFHRPFNSILATPNEPALGLATGSNYVYTLKNNINTSYTKNFQSTTRPNSGSSGGLNIDLYDNVSIPINYTILDVREPEKRKTNWSKTITIPGTKNNNRIFDHIYELGADGWMTIGSASVYESFNPNLRLECILQSGGIQVLKGNLQLKRITRDRVGNIEYEISISGDLTSLFFDIGTAKLSDLDFTEWDHEWSKENIVKSWYGVSRRNDVDYNSIIKSNTKTISQITRNAQSGRLTITTSSPHNYSLEDWVIVEPDTSVNSNFFQCAGEWQVVEVLSSTRFSVNYFYAVGLLNTGYSGTLGTVSKKTATGKGYVYPMINWGDAYDDNSYPVTSFIPGFYLKELWDKVFTETKSSYDSDFLNSQFFKRLILVQKKPSYDINPAEYASRKFWVGTTQSYSTRISSLQSLNWYYLNQTNTGTSSILPTTSPQRFPFASENTALTATVSFYDYYGNWNNDTYKWIVSDSGEYRLSVNVNVSCWCDMNGYTDSSANGTASFLPNDALYKYYPGPRETNPSGILGTNKVGTRVLLEVKRLRGGVVSTIGSTFTDFILNGASYWSSTNTNWPFFGRYQPQSWNNRTVLVETNSSDFRKGDEIWVETTSYIQSSTCNLSVTPSRKATISFFEAYDTPGSDDPIDRTNIVGEWYVRLEAQSYILNDPSPRSVENSILEAKSILPKEMECKDFLLGIIKMFNLHIEQDKQVDRKYYIEPRDDYYYKGTTFSEFADWTDKMDASSVEMIPMGELIAKYYVFENKEETDYWNKKFKEDRGRPYQYYRKEINNDFLKNESKITVPFGSTVMVNSREGSDVVIPSIFQREASGNAKPVSNSQPRILFWGGLRPYSAQRGGAKINLSNSSFPGAYGWELLSSVGSFTQSASASIYEQYPYAGTVDSPADPLIDINWYNMDPGDFVYWDNARWTNENLYNKYWSNFINEVSDPTSKVIVANIYLTPKDIYNLDFRKVYVLDGHWLRLQKIIDYDPVSDGLTKCEFLKLKSPTKFSRQTLIVDQFGSVNSEFSVATDTTRPVPVTTTVIAPPRKRPDLGYTNTSTGTNLSNNLTIQTSGLSNFVAPAAKNISIVGNENAVGDNCENISISGGSGNFIVGGVKNVNMIGTSKKYVAESDVTYINGIRYVNGVAVSKSTVIDGGLNVAQVRQSMSTTPNLVDSGEDVVIFSGSATFESVIDAGQDAILPDLPELGISTLTNPNPRTNLTSGYTTNYGTQSLVDVVRERAQSR